MLEIILINQTWKGHRFLLENMKHPTFLFVISVIVIPFNLISKLNPSRYLADFIVGAPYDGEDHRGAVYVYHGAKDGVRKEPTQRIEASKVNADLRAFGFSLAGGKDIDKNQYPGWKMLHFSAKLTDQLFALICADRLIDWSKFYSDIAVGAYQSAHAVVFKTKPVITVTGSLISSKSSINLENKTCPTEFGMMAWYIPL